MIERSVFGEYCENGMKAMAEEIQNKTIGSDFFTVYSIDELAEMSDYEIGKSGSFSYSYVFRRRKYSLSTNFLERSLC